MKGDTTYIKKIPFVISPDINKYLSGKIIYVENENNKLLTQFIKDNTHNIQEIISDYHFINLSDAHHQTMINREQEIIEMLNAVAESFGSDNDVEFPERKIDYEILQIIKYHYPKLKQKDLENTIKGYIPEPTAFINQLLKFEGKFNGGLVDFRHNNIIVFDLRNEKDLKELISQVFPPKDIVFYDPISVENTDDYFPLDEETEKHLKKITSSIDKLYENGTFFKVLPLIEKYIETTTQHPDSLSKLVITPDFKIILTDYQNMEIKMSHLTKAIYFLFLRNRTKGINLKELFFYKDELLSYYKKISNRNDYDKMQKSIADIIDPLSNAIYIHLSRIKSAFVKEIHPEIAKNYYITGYKNSPKKIKLDDKYIDDKMIYDNGNSNGLTDGISLF